MEKIKVEITWEDKNYCCGWGCEGFGAIVCTNKSLSSLKAEFEGALKSQISVMVADGEELPEWLVNGNYEIEYSLAVSAMLRQAEQFTTLAVISRYTGINQKLLSHYVNSVKTPRAPQREKIVSGLHAIGQQFMSVC